MHVFDVVIVGGGIVGLTLACGLKNSGLRVALVESTSPNQNELPAEPMLRVSAINLASEHLFDRIGVWDQILAQRITPFGSMAVRDQDSFGQITFHAQDYGHEHLGHIIENQVIERALWQQVRQSTEVELFLSTTPQQVIWGEAEAFVQLQNGHMLSSKLVVAADGADSWLRQHADIPLTFWEYGHHALVATIRTALPHGGCARQIFHGDGILAFLPLWQDNLSSIVWSLPPDRAQFMQSIDGTLFNRQLAVAFDMQLGLCELASERLTIPLMARYARSFARHRLVLAGDAAHTIHPLAGQGVNLGLADVTVLITELQRLQREGKDIGQHLYLRRYERKCKENAAIMLAAMQGFKALFSGTQPLKKLFRGVGLTMIDRMPNIKSHLVQQAMGLGI